MGKSREEKILIISKAISLLGIAPTFIPEISVLFFRRYKLSLKNFWSVEAILNNFSVVWTVWHVRQETQWKLKSLEVKISVCRPAPPEGSCPLIDKITFFLFMIN